MPYIHLQLAAARGVEASDAELAQALSDLSASVLHKSRHVTAVRVERCDPASWFIGGEAVAPQGQSTAHVQIQITAGTNTAIEKARFVTAAFDALAALLGELHPASYVVVEEIAADAWGYGGHTQAARRLQLATAEYR